MSSLVRVPARLLLLLCLSVGLVFLSPAGDAHAAKRGGAERAAGVALQQLGDPYRWGGTGPNAFDCSGLLQYSFRKAGIKIPRTSSAQAGAARKISKSQLRRGDVMFFHSGGRVYHAAIYLGRSGGKVQMVHAPGSGKRVTRATPWTSSWFAGTFRGKEPRPVRHQWVPQG